MFLFYLECRVGCKAITWHYLELLYKLHRALPGVLQMERHKTTTIHACVRILQYLINFIFRQVYFSLHSVKIAFSNKYWSKKIHTNLQLTSIFSSFNTFYCFPLFIFSKCTRIREWGYTRLFPSLVIIKNRYQKLYKANTFLVSGILAIACLSPVLRTATQNMKSF